MLRTHPAVPRLASRLDEIWSAFVALVATPEPIDLLEQRFNFLPYLFRWRGNLQRVRRVERIWDRQNRAGHSPRRYFQVVCQGGGQYILFQDLRLGTWHVRTGGA